MSTSFKNVTPTGPGGTATLLIVLSFTGFLLLTQSLFVVPSGQVAAVTTLGKVSGPSRRAGLNFKLPFVQSVYPFDIKTQVQPEKFETLTKDLQVIRATATVKYSVKPNEAGRIFATIASRNSDVYQKIVQPSLLKALKSVISNAENNHSLDIDKLYVKEAFVGKGIVMKRFHARARGRGARILKPFSHLTIILSEETEEKNGSKD